MAGREIITIEALMVAMRTPRVVLLSTIHLYRGWFRGTNDPRDGDVLESGLVNVICPPNAAARPAGRQRDDGGDRWSHSVSYFN
jgi:hypothetical protein